jgi:hypothetical protein
VEEGEDGYAFRFSKNQAIKFLHGTQAEYGEATEVKR